mmetsp:Transcript_77699/g.214739  ORF Transcript_77699/g.214739 Transcript_77699/m.214739 type:complete len:223 (+) Transcript_77699:509-1177(+)
MLDLCHQRLRLLLGAKPDITCINLHCGLHHGHLPLSPAPRFGFRPGARCLGLIPGVGLHSLHAGQCLRPDCPGLLLGPSPALLELLLPQLFAPPFLLCLPAVLLRLLLLQTLCPPQGGRSRLPPRCRLCWQLVRLGGTSGSVGLLPRLLLPLPPGLRLRPQVAQLGPDYVRLHLCTGPQGLRLGVNLRAYLLRLGLRRCGLALRARPQCLGLSLRVCPRGGR